jgi:hypothetical protein
MSQIFIFLSLFFLVASFLLFFFSLEIIYDVSQPHFLGIDMKTRPLPLTYSLQQIPRDHAFGIFLNQNGMP